MSDLPERLRQACNGHPNAEIPWPHRLLHEAADEIEKLRAEVEALTVALCRIRGWREVDLPEGNRCARAIEYIEQVADSALRGEGEE